MTTSRTARARALERWADEVRTSALVEVDVSALRRLAELAEQRRVVDLALTQAVTSAREHGASWAEIGSALGVSKQAAQQRYGRS